MSEMAEFIRPAAGTTPYWLRSSVAKENGLVKTITSTGSVEVEGESGETYWIVGRNVLGMPEPGAFGTVYAYRGAAKGRHALVLDAQGVRWGDETEPEAAIEAEPEPQPEVEMAIDVETPDLAATAALRDSLDDLARFGFGVEGLASALGVEMPEALPEPVSEPLVVAEPEVAAAPEQPDTAPLAPDPVALPPSYREKRRARSRSEQEAVAPEPELPAVLVAPPAASRIPHLEEIHLREVPAAPAAPAPQTGLLVDSKALYQLLTLQAQFMQALLVLIEPIFVPKPPPDADGS